MGPGHRPCAGALRSAPTATVQPMDTQPDHRANIVTPEAVVLEFERAGVPSRILAIALDVLALGAIWLALTLIAVQLFGGIEDVFGAVLAVLFSLGVYLAWFCGFETLMQRTPGKAAFGLLVVAADGTPVRFQQAFLRALVGIVDFVLIPFGFVAVVASLLSPQDQRLGDMAAGTLVVRQRSASKLTAPAQFLPPPGHEAYVGSLDIGGMTAEQYELVRRFLLRAHQLTPMARVQLAVELANPLAEVLHHSPPPGLHPELFLVCVVAAWQQAHGTPATSGPAAASPSSVPAGRGLPC